MGAVLALLFSVAMGAQAGGKALSLGPKDVRVEPSSEGGYLLVIRKKPEIQSVMLTESSADPQRKLDSYALRAKDYHPLNGDEKRRLEGRFIESPGMYFLLSSTVVPDAEFGQAFRIFLPYQAVFGYPQSRYGEISLQDGAYLNIRSFSLPYADYAKPYQDNPYTLRLVQATRSPGAAGAADGYNKEAVKAFAALAQLGSAPLQYAKAGDGFLPALQSCLAAAGPGAWDLVLCLDATKSMEPEAPFIRRELAALLKAFLREHPGSRLGLVQYRDYLEEFLFQVAPLDPSAEKLAEHLSQYFPGEGRDTPEAVFEGLYAGLTEMSWVNPQRLMILAGDAPPHPSPRGSVSREMVQAALEAAAVDLKVLILPD